MELFDTILLCTFTVCFLNMRRIEDMAFFLPPQRLVYYVCISSAQFSIWSLSSVLHCVFSKVRLLCEVFSFSLFLLFFPSVRLERKKEWNNGSCSIFIHDLDLSIFLVFRLCFYLCLRRYVPVSNFPIHDETNPKISWRLQHLSSFRI